MACGYATREEAEEEAERYRRLTAPLHSASVASALRLYIAEQVKRGKWRKDAEAYVTKVNLLGRFLRPVEDIPIGSVSPQHITRCCAAWDTEERPAYWTRHLARFRAEAFFNWCVERQLLKQSPVKDEHKVPRDKSPIRRRLRIDEARRLRAVVDPAAAQGDASAVFVLTALFLGSRTSELLGLTASSFDDDGRVLSYHDAKDPERLHEVRLPEELVEPMRLLAARAGDGWLFQPSSGKRESWGPASVRRWAKEAGLARWAEMDVRWMRRTKDTLAVEAGMSPALVARETGHTLHIARKHYIAGGAETTGRAVEMERATRAPVQGREVIGTGICNTSK
jgi:integrase